MMKSSTLTVYVAALTVASSIGVTLAANVQPRQSTSGYTDPTTNGGSMLTRLNSSSQLGEPINVIISADSDKQVLTKDGLSEYFESLYFSPGDCAGLSAGGAQQANLGDGQGYVNQTDVARFNYYQGDGGTCLESIKGGNHFRYWTQQTTGAVFIAASVEYSAAQSHMIVPNGYDLGRDWLAGNATNQTGTTSPGGYAYTTTTNQVSLLQSVDASSINHGIGVDGSVTVFTVRVDKTGQMGANRTNEGGSSSSTSASSSLSSFPCVPISLLFALFVSAVCTIIV